MRCIYVAGAYSADDVISVFSNMRRGIHLALEVLSAGFAPFVPWFDYHFSLLEYIPLHKYYAYSMAWLEKADGLIIQPTGSRKSVGTQKELQRARELGIPIFRNIEQMKEYFDERRNQSA
jgi:hypothetical protein